MKELMASSIREIAGMHAYVTPSKSEQLKDAILNSLTAQIAVLGPDGIIETVNDAWKQFEKENTPQGLPALDCIGMNYLEVCKQSQGRSSEEAQQTFKGILAVLQGTISSFTIEYPCDAPSKKRWFLMSVTALPDSLGAVVSHTDITERKTIEQMKDEFISIASHELKTPLTSLKGIVHILQLSFLNKMKGEGAKLLNTMDIQLDKLTKIIGDFLNVNALPGKNLPFNYEEFEFKNLVQETVENVSTLSQLHFLTVQENETIICRGDRLRLEQVITNLLTNAVKYSPQSNQVFINSVVKDNKILLSVQDFGIGVNKENITRIFDRFYRVNNGLRFGGLGLGLYISSEIIKAHKGNLWVESQPGKGSTFYLTLPLR